MKLLLTSSGVVNEELEKAFSDLIQNRKNLKVAVIPTAGDPIDWIKSELPGYDVIPKIDEEKVKENLNKKSETQEEYEAKGFEVIVVDLKKDPDWVREQLSKVDIIHVGGGDVNWLCDWVRIAKLDTYLKTLLEKGVVFIGTSAGSNMVTPSFGLGWWTPKCKESHAGLGIVDFCLAVHQREGDERNSEHKIIENREKIKEFIVFPWIVYLLKDGQAIKVDGDKIEHIGPGIKKSV